LSPLSIDDAAANVALSEDANSESKMV
jgi:hypothetical protein